MLWVQVQVRVTRWVNPTSDLQKDATGVTNGRNFFWHIWKFGSANKEKKEKKSFRKLSLSVEVKQNVWRNVLFSANYGPWVLGRLQLLGDAATEAARRRAVLADRERRAQAVCLRQGPDIRRHGFGLLD